MKEVNIKQVEGEEIPTEVIAEHIKTIAEGIQKLRRGRLNDRALLILIQNAAPSTRNGKVGVTEIRAIQTLITK